MTGTPHEPSDLPSPPEYGPVEAADDGHLTATHLGDGTTIHGDNADELERKATAHRIASSLRQRP